MVILGFLEQLKFGDLIKKIHSLPPPLLLLKKFGDVIEKFSPGVVAGDERKGGAFFEALPVIRKPGRLLPNY